MAKKIVLIMGLVLTMVSGVLLLGGCTAEEGTDTTTSTIYMVVFLVLMAVVFYFFIIRPQTKRQKEQRDIIASLQPGDKVITIGGIYGKIESLREDSVILKVESGTTMRFMRSAIAGKQEEAGQ